MMASTSRSTDVGPRAPPTASRRSITSQAASASRDLTSSASASISSPYAGLGSSSSSSSSLASSHRRSIPSGGRNSFSRYSIPSPTTTHTPTTDRRTGSSSSASPGNLTHQADVSVASTVRRSSRSSNHQAAEPSHAPVRPQRAPGRPTARRTSSRQQRRHSAESLRLDLDGLDLGGDPALGAPTDHAEASSQHVRSRSNTTQPYLPGSKHPIDGATYNGVRFDPTGFCSSCVDEQTPQTALNGIEDSFSHHLRAECSDYREIMSSQTILNAAVDKQNRMRNSSVDTVGTYRSRGFSISHGQVLGGFASLGLQTETGPQPPAPVRQQPIRTITKGSTDSSEAPATPIKWRDSFGMFGGIDYNPPPKWAHLTARPCNPLEPLDVLSIEEMGLHSLDVGSLNDWEGCKLSAEILCPINGHQRIEWSVAQTTRRNKKWVVVPNATVTCGTTEVFSSAAQAERTVIVSNRSLWLDESDASVSQQRESSVPAASASSSVQRQPGSTALGSLHRSSMPFSGKAGFELRLLRPTSGRIHPPVYLANASTHRYLRQYRQGVDLTALQKQGRVVKDASDQIDLQTSPPVYPTLRRSRSRPYLRNHQAPLRRSRSKPYMRQAQQQTEPASATGTNPEVFAPSLPGDPLVRMHPEESWPSARSGHSNSLSSLGSPLSSASGSDTSSSDEAGLSTTNTRESTMGSTTTASFDQPLGKNAEQTRSAAIPMAVGGAHSSRAQRGLSPTSSASRGISSNSESSGALAGWQPGSLEKQRLQPRSGHTSASFEAESWQGSTSPPTASTSSMSANSKQSRSRNGLQKALKKKDKVLNSLFKRRPESGATPTSVSPVTDSERPQAGSVPSNGVGNGAGSKSKRARDGSDSSGNEPKADATPLTESALESFQRSMFVPASPDPTVTGSRRGSEALTQKAVEASGTAGAVQSNGNGAERLFTSGADNRVAVNSALSRVYGWDEQEAASKTLRPIAVPAAVSFEDLDEGNALLGLDAVPAAALTMLIPLPLIGRNRAQDAVRYMRVNFVPFNSFSETTEAAPGSTLSPAAVPHSVSPSVEAEPALSQSTSSSTMLASKSEQSGWKRKLGLTRPTTTALPALDTPQPSPTLTKFEPFRMTAIVHNAPWTSSNPVDPRLPEPGTFPVVLGYCNDGKGLEMVPEGWGALRLAGVPIPTKEDGSPLDGVHPLNGVSDLIIAACTAVMDV